MKQTTKRLMCLLLAAVVGSIPSIGAQAAAEDAQIERQAIQVKISSISSDISEAVPLSKADIQNLVDYQIETYIATEHEAAGKILTAGETDSWIPLADLEGSCFAYLVPLVDQEDGEIGYITMGAIEDGFTKYMLAWDTDLLESYRDILGSMPEAVPVFFQPLQYGYMIDCEENKDVFLMLEDGSEAVNITAAVAENAEQFTASYQAVRSSENAARLESSLDMAEQIQQSGTARAAARVAVEDVRLSCEWQGTNKFIPIVDNNGNTSYGGNQNWYEDSERQKNGCGPVAASNILYYMSITDSKYKKLYPYTTLSIVNFRGFMNIMYGYMKPAWFGETSFVDWTQDIICYASEKGITLSATPCMASASRDFCANYIKRGLGLDRPVGSVNLAAKLEGSIEAWHWVTITKYYQGSDNNRWVAVSSMGVRRSIDWDAYYKNINQSLLMGGFAYFD